jgi:hypothetical protein
MLSLERCGGFKWTVIEVPLGSGDPTVDVRWDNVDDSGFCM